LKNEITLILCLRLPRRKLFPETTYVQLPFP
jgi:hypothetical protein